MEKNKCKSSIRCLDTNSSFSVEYSESN